jgi:hypothetical protein
MLVPEGVEAHSAHTYSGTTERHQVRLVEVATWITDTGATLHVVPWCHSVGMHPTMSIVGCMPHRDDRGMKRSYGGYRDLIHVDAGSVWALTLPQHSTPTRWSRRS